MLRKRKGMTLVEIVVAMAVFAIVISTLLPAFIFAARLNIVSKVGIDVTAIARQEAEKFYAYSRVKTFAETMDLSEVKNVYNISGVDPIMLIPKETSDYVTTKHVRIVLSFWDGVWDGTTHDGMTKIRILVTIMEGYNTQNALPEQIDSILLFK